MLKKLLASALFAGFAAGLIAVVQQFAFVQQVLLQSELYENGEIEHFSAPVAHDHASGHGQEAEPAPKTVDEAHDHSDHDHGATENGGIDFKRDGLSVVFSIFTYVGYALMLVAVFALAESQGITITQRSGLLWGLAGYLCVQFAPAFGLAPELPGNAAADLGSRQVWWFSTVILTAVGLWLLAFSKNKAMMAVGAVAILLPHLIGAPHPDGFNGPAPPELASLYATRALGVGLIAWITLGMVAAYFWRQDES